MSTLRVAAFTINEEAGITLACEWPLARRALNSRPPGLPAPALRPEPTVTVTLTPTEPERTEPSEPRGTLFQIAALAFRARN